MRGKEGGEGGSFGKSRNESEIKEGGKIRGRQEEIERDSKTVFEREKMK